jgi:hypothetical protein
VCWPVDALDEVRVGKELISESGLGGLRRLDGKEPAIGGRVTVGDSLKIELCKK